MFSACNKTLKQWNMKSHNPTIIQVSFLLLNLYLWADPGGQRGYLTLLAEPYPKKIGIKMLNILFISKFIVFYKIKNNLYSTFKGLHPPHSLLHIYTTLVKRLLVFYVLKHAQNLALRMILVL